MSSLKYTNAIDHTYGVAGMALAAYIFDFEKYLAAISIEAQANGSDIAFTPDFDFAPSEAISAKAAWESMLNHTNITAILLISNVMCRNMVQHRRDISNSLRQTMLTALHTIAKDSLPLDDDEIDSIFDKHYTYLHEAFCTSRIHNATQRIVDNLSRRRTLSHHDLRDLLGE